MADDPQQHEISETLSRLERHRALHLHDAVIDDLNELAEMEAEADCA